MMSNQLIAERKIPTPSTAAWSGEKVGEVKERERREGGKRAGAELEMKREYLNTYVSLMVG